MPVIFKLFYIAKEKIMWVIMGTSFLLIPTETVIKGINKEFIAHQIIAAIIRFVTMVVLLYISRVLLKRSRFGRWIGHNWERLNFGALSKIRTKKTKNDEQNPG